MTKAELKEEILRRVDEAVEHDGPLTARDADNLDRLLPYLVFLFDQRQAEAEDAAEEEICQVPPAGWRCTRKAGHRGPCAAIPVESKR